MIFNETNIKLEEMIASLQPLLQRRDKLGYIAARNTRAISNAIKDFVDFRYELVKEYGLPEIDDEGNPTGRTFVSESDPKFNEFYTKLHEIGDIKQEVDLMTLEYDEVVGVLSGEEIFQLDWMLVDQEV